MTRRVPGRLARSDCDRFSASACDITTRSNPFCEERLTMRFAIKLITGSVSKILLGMIMVIGVSSVARADLKVEKVEYKGWQNCYRVSNGEVELIVTGDVGPRVIRFGFVGGQNLFKEYADQLGKTGEKKFQLR